MFSEKKRKYNKQEKEEKEIIKKQNEMKEKADRAKAACPLELFTRSFCLKLPRKCIVFTTNLSSFPKIMKIRKSNMKKN